MWRNFSFPCMTIVGKLKFSIAFYDVLLLNLLFTLFCRDIFATIYALSCGEKLGPKVHLWRKNDKYQVCVELTRWGGRHFARLAIAYLRNKYMPKHLQALTKSFI